jgi:hypothetical protein
MGGTCSMQGTIWEETWSGEHTWDTMAKILRVRGVTVWEQNLRVVKTWSGSKWRPVVVSEEHDDEEYNKGISRACEKSRGHVAVTHDLKVKIRLKMKVL